MDKFRFTTVAATGGSVIASKFGSAVHAPDYPVSITYNDYLNYFTYCVRRAGVS